MNNQLILYIIRLIWIYVFFCKYEYLSCLTKNQSRNEREFSDVVTWNEHKLHTHTSHAVWWLKKMFKNVFDTEQIILLPSL